jgi:hypothetical protein
MEIAGALREPESPPLKITYILLICQWRPQLFCARMPARDASGENSLRVCRESKHRIGRYLSSDHRSDIDSGYPVSIRASMIGRLGVGHAIPTLMRLNVLNCDLIWSTIGGERIDKGCRGEEPPFV